MLKRLHLENVGPASQMDVEFADRLNVFTGDNGLGKTFILDIVWWLMTNGGSQPHPLSPSNTPRIEYIIDYWVESDNKTSSVPSLLLLEYQSRQQFWKGAHFNPANESVLGLYARVNGGFSFFDSLRLIPAKEMFDQQAHYLELSADQLWNGLELDDFVVCNGLIQDLGRWQTLSNQIPFSLLRNIVKMLFPAEETPILGETTRVSLKDVRDIPILELPYGKIPITNLSAGMKRVISFSYSLVWAWYEHQQAAKLANVKPAKRMFLLVDEMESHLHPQWQRSIFPAILEAIKLLDPDIKVQVLTTTHSPLVLASLEPYFDEETDKLFGFDLVDREVVLEEMPWVKLGEVDDWLTSPIFGLSRPRSKESEVAIDAAFAVMRNADMSDFPAHLRTQDDIDRELHQVLPDHDSFWRRWVVTAEEVKVR
jgi:AAA domain, putative AbiEii toxin, Type IV TA system/AAA domain